MDFGYHPPTIYFPLIVPEALMIEPTETESKADAGFKFIDGHEARSRDDIEERSRRPSNPRRTSPRCANWTRRLAARQPCVCWTPPARSKARMTRQAHWWDQTAFPDQPVGQHERGRGLAVCGNPTTGGVRASRSCGCIRWDRPSVSDRSIATGGGPRSRRLYPGSADACGARPAAAPWSMAAT